MELGNSADAKPMGQAAHSFSRALKCVPSRNALVIASVISAAICLFFPSMSMAASSKSSLASLKAKEHQLLRNFTNEQQVLFGLQDRYEALMVERNRALRAYGNNLALLYMSGNLANINLVIATESVHDAFQAVSVATEMSNYRQQLMDTAKQREKAASKQDSKRQTQAAKMGGIAVKLEIVQRIIADRESIILRRKAKRLAAKNAAREALAASRTTQQQTTMAYLTSYATSSFGASWSGNTTPASAQAIDLYLAGKGSPMTGSGTFFMMSGSQYGVDPRFVVAIAGAESSFGKQTCGAFNAWGWACPNNPSQFTSWGDGIDHVTSSLRRYYLDEGRTSVAAVHEKYAPNGAANDPTGLNNYWVTNVSKFLVEQGGNPGSIAMQPASSGTLASQS